MSRFSYARDPGDSEESLLTRQRFLDDVNIYGLLLVYFGRPTYMSEDFNKRCCSFFCFRPPNRYEGRP